MHNKNNQYGRWKGWITLCVSITQRFGLPPISSPNLHELLYLGNTLASCYEIEPVRGRVLKRGSLPFFPDVQTEIDKLAYCGILKINKVKYGQMNALAAYYEMGPLGLDIESQLIKDAEMYKVSKLFQEIVSASARRLLGKTGDIGDFDANYSDTNVFEGEVVDFSEWSSNNYNQDVVDYMLINIQSLKPSEKRDGVRLYCGYLEEAIIE